MPITSNHTIHQQMILAYSIRPNWGAKKSGNVDIKYKLQCLYPQTESTRIGTKTIRTIYVLVNKFENVEQAFI